MTTTDTTGLPTPEQSAAMEAGAELDALVTRVVGWHTKPCPWAVLYPALAAAEVPPRYSSNMNDAMRAAEAVGLFKDYSLTQYPAPSWWVGFERDAETIATGDTPALAVARAVAVVGLRAGKEGRRDG